jgi:PDZ domain
MMTNARRALLALLAAVPLLAAPLEAQSAARTCQGGRGTLTADLGYENIECNCTMFTREGRWHFRSEPTVTGIRDGGPAEGRLRDGDVIVAVDGMLITTEQAGRRFGAIRAGDSVRLSVRRNGRVRDVTIRAGERCFVGPQAPRAPQAPRPPVPPVPPAPRTPPAPRPPRAPAPPAPAVAPTPPAPPRAPEPPPPPPAILPDGWFGFGIECGECGWRRRGREVVWTFSSAPVVTNVEPGSPAARAGLRRGDQLTFVDGVALTRPEGGEKFVSIRPGQTVRWTYRRGGLIREATIRAERRPDYVVSPAPTPPAVADRLRYSGSVGNTAVEVRGAPVTVSVDERTGETVIRSRDLTVRIRPERP